MQNFDIAIVVLSCDKFRVTWKPCIDHFFNAWCECPYPVYLLNNFSPSEDDRVIDLMIGDDLNWSDSLKKGLGKVPAKRIFFHYDDTFLRGIDVEEVQSIFDMAIENDCESVALRRRKFDRGKRFNDKIYKLNSRAKYRTSLYQNLIKKDVVLDLLESGESAWEFEKIGSTRSSRYNFYSVYQRGLIIEYHGIIKGKWMPAVWKYLKNQGYSLDGDRFEHHSRLQVVKMWARERLFYLYHTIMHPL